MGRQTINFLSEGAVAVVAEIREDLSGIHLQMLFNPAGAPHSAVYATADEVADIVGAKVDEHMAEHRSRVLRIILRHDQSPLTYGHLSRYAAPIFPMADGQDH